MSSAKDYYKILEVTKNASESDIKRSFRRLSKLYHPDTNPDDKTLNAKFQEIKEAYEVLSDLQKRKEYDYSLTNAGRTKIQMSSSNDNNINDLLNKFDNFKF